MKHLNHGYMLVLSLMVVALAMIMVTGVVNRATIHTSTMHVLVTQEKARLLALSGLEIALCRLANPEMPDDKKQQEKQEPGKPNPKQQAISLIETLLPQLDSWQVFTIEEHANVEYGKIKLCIGSEEGKLNINQVYDFNKHEFIGGKSGPKELVELLCKALEKSTGAKNLFEKLSSLLKERSYPLNDITELCSIKELSSAFAQKIFLEPQDAAQQKAAILYLTDIFTTWTKSKMIQPWLLSPSLKQALGFQQFGKGQEKKLEEILKKFELQTDWTKNWDQLLKPIYGKNFAGLPASLKPLLDTKFEPMVFSVVSYGFVKNITQRLYAIVERKQRPSSTDGGPAFETVVKRLYWL